MLCVVSNATANCNLNVSFSFSASDALWAFLNYHNTVKVKVLPYSLPSDFLVIPQR